MLAPMTITFADETTVVVTPKASDGIRFERTYNTPIMKAFSMGEIYMEHLWYFAFLAFGRDREVGSFDEWMDSVESVEFVEQDEPAVPLDPTV